MDMANRACLVWITLLGAIESLDILTTGMGQIYLNRAGLT